MSRNISSINTIQPKSRKECRFCRENVIDVDHKKAEILRRYTGAWGKILPASRTGVCSKHQRRLTTAIKRARHLALLPFTTH